MCLDTTSAVFVAANSMSGNTGKVNSTTGGFIFTILLTFIYILKSL
jgi:hypothetical protein